jgi:hypothetical protein
MQELDYSGVKLSPYASERVTMPAGDDGTVRLFSSGATRDTAEGKLEPWGFTSALAEKAFSEYMHRHRVQSDGSLRDSGNWKKGIPLTAFFHSLSRHILEFRLLWESDEDMPEDLIEVLCAVKFNVDGMLHELVKLYEARNV